MWEREILPGLNGRKPSKIKPGWASEVSLLGDALSERDRDLIRMKLCALSPWPWTKWTQFFEAKRLQIAQIPCALCPLPSALCHLFFRCGWEIKGEDGAP